MTWSSTVRAASTACTTRKRCFSSSTSSVIKSRRPSGALSLMLRLASYSELTDQLRSSLTSRAVIYQALGVIMAQERCTQTKAFEILRTASQHSNVKLRDIASAIVTSVSGEPPEPHPFEES